MLTRWFPAADVTATEAKWLDVILYSREQLAKEYAAMPTKQGAGEQVVVQLAGSGCGCGALGIDSLVGCRSTDACLPALPARAVPVCRPWPCPWPWPRLPCAAAGCALGDHLHQGAG